jgi:hypothetical protein
VRIPSYAERVEERGMWVGSELRFSFHCTCGWVSDQRPTVAEAREQVRHHVYYGTHPGRWKFRDGGKDVTRE